MSSLFHSIYSWAFTVCFSCHVFSSLLVSSLLMSFSFGDDISFFISVQRIMYHVVLGSWDGRSLPSAKTLNVLSSCHVVLFHFVLLNTDYSSSSSFFLPSLKSFRELHRSDLLVFIDSFLYISFTSKGDSTSSSRTHISFSCSSFDVFSASVCSFTRVLLELKKPLPSSFLWIFLSLLPKTLKCEQNHLIFFSREKNNHFLFFSCIQEIEVTLFRHTTKFHDKTEHYLNTSSSVLFEQKDQRQDVSLMRRVKTWLPVKRLKAKTEKRNVQDWNRTYTQNSQLTELTEQN